MGTSARTLAPTPAPEKTSASLAAKSALIVDEVGPSRAMEIGLHGLVSGLLIVSIIGIAYVYGFNLETGSLLDNISAAVRALGVDGGFFLGLYFSRRLWMRKKHGWWDGIRTTVFGLIWFAVALLMASLSWFSNTLFVANYQTIITEDLLAKAGFTSISPQLVNKAIGAIPLVIVLLYSIVPRQSRTVLDVRSPEEIEEEALREAARIRAQNMVAAARAEGAGQRIRTVLGGLVNEAFNLEEAKKHDESLKQMRIALETAGYTTDGLNDEQIEIQAVARGVWDQAANKAIQSAASPAAQAEGTQVLSMRRQPVPRRDLLSVDALDQEEMEVWQPVERSWGKVEALPERSSYGAHPARSTGHEASLTFDELADALHVAHGTVAYWARPDFTGPTRIHEHEVSVGADGIKRVGPEVLLRLLRTHTKAGPHKANGVLPSLPAGANGWKDNGSYS
jgi:hypothetical protein